MSLIDYIQNFGTQTFEDLPFNDLDGTVLAQLAYVNFKQLTKANITSLVTLNDPAIMQQVVSGTWNEAGNLALLINLKNSRRFGQLTWRDPVLSVDPAAEKQFCAVTFDLSPQPHYIAYRGTTANLTDWKEDFNMTFERDVPSQRAALRYLQQQASHHPGAYYLGGHSKGGNLAVFACVHSRGFVQDSILRVYSIDGPGLNQEIPTHLLPKIKKFIPQASVIGLLLEPETGYQVVKSNVTGFREHDPYTWETDGSEFKVLTSTNRFSHLTQASITAWLNGLDDATKEAFLDSVFTVLKATNYQDFRQMGANWFTTLRLVTQAVNLTDPQTKQRWKSVTDQLFSAVFNELKPDISLKNPLTDWKLTDQLPSKKPKQP